MDLTVCIRNGALPVGERLLQMASRPDSPFPGDFTLVASKDGGRHSVHSAVLADVSPFFNALVCFPSEIDSSTHQRHQSLNTEPQTTAAFIEHQQRQAELCIDSVTLRLLLKWVYSRENLNLNVDQVALLFVAASQFMIDDLACQLRTSLFGDLDATQSNELGSRETAKKHQEIVPDNAPLLSFLGSAAFDALSPLELIALSTLFEEMSMRSFRENVARHLRRWISLDLHPPNRVEAMSDDFLAQLGLKKPLLSSVQDLQSAAASNLSDKSGLTSDGEHALATFVDSQKHNTFAVYLFGSLWGNGEPAAVSNVSTCSSKNSSVMSDINAACHKPSECTVAQDLPSLLCYRFYRDRFERRDFPLPVSSAMRLSGLSTVDWPSKLRSWYESAPDHMCFLRDGYLAVLDNSRCARRRSTIPGGAPQLPAEALDMGEGIEPAVFRLIDCKRGVVVREAACPPATATELICVGIAPFGQTTFLWAGKDIFVLRDKVHCQRRRQIERMRQQRADLLEQGRQDVLENFDFDSACFERIAQAPQKIRRLFVTSFNDDVDLAFSLGDGNNRTAGENESGASSGFNCVSGLSKLELNENMKENHNHSTKEHQAESWKGSLSNRGRQTTPAFACVLEVAENETDEDSVLGAKPVAGTNNVLELVVPSLPNDEVSGNAGADAASKAHTSLVTRGSRDSCLIVAGEDDRIVLYRDGRVEVRRRSGGVVATIDLRSLDSLHTLSEVPSSSTLSSTNDNVAGLSTSLLLGGACWSMTYTGGQLLLLRDLYVDIIEVETLSRRVVYHGSKSSPCRLRLETITASS